MSSVIKPVLGSQPNPGHFLMPDAGFWLFNEGSGNKVFDLSGSGGVGTLTGTAPSWGVGEYGSIITLPGTDEYINVPHKSVYDMPFPCTIFGRIKPADAATSQNIITTHTWSGTYYGYSIHLVGGTALQASFGDGAGDGLANRKTKLGTTALVNGVWYDFMVVFHSATDFTIYLDGKDDGGSFSGSAAAVAFNTSPLKIGFDDGTTDYFNGDVDFMGMASRGYTVEEAILLCREPFIMFERDPIELWVGSTESVSATTITLYGAAGVSAVTPRFDFSGTIAVEVEGVFIKNLVSGVEDSISLAEGEKLEYICSDWDSITRIDMQNDKVSGDISGWTLPDSLVIFYVNATSVSGDISGWTLPNNLATFYVYNTSVSGDISGWTLPSSLVYFSIRSTSVSGNISGWILPSNLISFNVYSTSVSGDISGWTLPSSLTHFYVHITSVSGDISGWTLPSSLVLFYIYNTQLDYDSLAGLFTGVTDSLTKIDFDNCNLTSTQVDNALADLVTSGIDNSVSSKALDIGDNNSGPSSAGWSNKEALETRGWTVKINAIAPPTALAGYYYRHLMQGAA